MNSNTFLVTTIAHFRFENFIAKKLSTSISLLIGYLKHILNRPGSILRPCAPKYTYRSFVRTMHFQPGPCIFTWNRALSEIQMYSPKISASTILVLLSSIPLTWKVLSKKIGERLVKGQNLRADFNRLK